MIRKRYADGGYGQLHLRENEAVGGVPLICLHATAYSSRSFATLLDLLDGRRHVIAPDTPGYGESDSPPAPVAIGDYANAMVDGLPARFDVFGYHTGVSIAAEMAIRHPRRIGRLIFMGVPYFQALDFAAWREKLTARHALGDTLDQFEERWRFLVTERPRGTPLRRGFENFVDETKAWPDGWWAHDALFAHDLPGRLRLVRQPATILNPPGHLAGPSRLAAALMAHADVIELPDRDGAPLDAHAKTIARLATAPELVAG